MTLLFIFAICLATGFAMRVLRRLPRLAFLATLIGAGGMFAVLTAAPDEAFSFVGRTLTLDAATRAFLLPALGATAALALLTPLTFLRASDQPAGVITNSQGAYLFWSVAPFVIAIGLDSFPLAVIAWAIGLMALIFLAQPRQTVRVGGAFQFLLLIVVATASLLLANRLLELYPLTPENFDLVRGAAFFLVLGLGILLAVVPLNIWLGAFADEMPLLGIAALLAVAQPVGLWLLIQLFAQTTGLEKSPLFNALMTLGALSAIGGAVLALTERRDNRFLAALALFALGDALLGLGLETRVGLASASLAMIDRALGIALVAGGISFVRFHPEQRWQTVGIIAVLAGGMELLGFAPTPGAAARWALYRDLDVGLVGALIAANAAGLIALMRFVLPLIAARDVGAEVHAEIKIIPYWGAAVVIALIAASVITGFAPQLIVDPLLAVASKIEFLK
ncbi:MAG: hypothetical protein HY327_07625 [Chloroflexi bacterium]|nr:hypothetical protein [Chloroflexota bacterium]